MIRVGLIGFGYWGPNLARNFAESDGATVVAVADLNDARLAVARRRYPGVRTTTNPAEVIDAPDIDAIAIATPVSSHFQLGSAALAAGKHVLIEKPLAASADEARRLIDLAAARRRVLLVDHTFIYSGPVAKIRELMTTGQLGDPYYYDSVRVNLGLFQHDVNVLWDLAVHDLSIMEYVLGREPCEVSATGLAHVAGHPANVAFLTLFFDAPLIAHIHVNWMAPVKVRRTLLGASRRMVVYDDLDPADPVKIYDRGIDITEDPAKIYQMMVDYRTGDMWAPTTDRREALRLEVEHFLSCIRDGVAPRTDGEAGLRVVRILEAASRSLALKGQAITIAGD